MSANLDLIRPTYEGPPAETRKALRAALADDVEWTEMKTFQLVAVALASGLALASVISSDRGARQD